MQHAMFPVGKGQARGVFCYLVEMSNNARLRNLQ